MQQLLPAIGLFGILLLTALVIVRMMTVYITGRVHRVRAAAELVVFLAILYLLIEPGVGFVGAGSLVATVERAVISATVICLAFLLNGVIRTVFWDGLLSDHGKRTVPIIVSEGVGLAIYLVAILLLMHFVYDQPIGGLLATSGVVALVLGFAAQSTLKEVFSGVALNATQALRLGDFVEIDGIYGQVYEINWRSISIKNPHTDSLYIFPNSGVADRTILNFSEPTGRFKYFVHFTVELSAPPELVIRAIAEELEHSRYVRRDPKPDFNMLGYNKEGVEIRIRYFFDGDDPWWDAQNEVIMAIWTAMRKHRLRIAVNRHWLGSGDEWMALDERTETVFGAETIRERIGASRFFSNCTESTLDEIVSTVSVVSLNPPGCFYAPGERPDGIYLVLEGNVALYRRVDDIEGQEVKVENCRPGELFGIHSFIEATPRIYLAQAEQYSVVAHLPGDTMHRLMAEQPDLKAGLAEHLAVRRDQRERNAAIAHRELLFARHATERLTLSEEIRQNVDEILERPAFHHFMSLISSRVRHEDIMSATMAGAAIIAACRGAVDEQEEGLLRKAMSEADLLRHMDSERALKQFRKFASSPDVGRPEGSVYSMLDRCKELKGGSRIVHAIALGMTGVHGAPTQDELRALDRICERIGVENTRPLQPTNGEGHG